MRWLRTHAKKLSMLALFALAVQFGLSFGHFHPDGLLTVTATSAQSVSTSHTGHDSDARADICAICATVAMASTAIDAPPPALPLPAVFSRTAELFFAGIGIAEPRRTHAQSRAPPAA